MQEQLSKQRQSNPETAARTQTEAVRAPNQATQHVLSNVFKSAQAMAPKAGQDSQASSKAQSVGATPEFANR